MYSCKPKCTEHKDRIDLVKVRGSQERPAVIDSDRQQEIYGVLSIVFAVSEDWTRVRNCHQPRLDVSRMKPETKTFEQTTVAMHRPGIKPESSQVVPSDLGWWHSHFPHLRIGWKDSIDCTTP